MKKPLKCLLALVLVVCTLMSYAVPSVNGAWWDEWGDDDTTDSENVTYNFDLLSEYNGVPSDSGGKSNPFAYILTGNLGNSKQQKSIPERFASGDLNWTYEAASAGVCGSTTQEEHLPLTSGNRMLAEGLRSTMSEGGWIAFRIKSPGAGEYTMDLNFYGQTGSPTVAIYILEAEGEASIDHDTVLARQEAIHAAMDPDNRVGKADLNAGKANKANTATIGKYTFEADKEYIVVIENYKAAAIPGNYTYLTSLYFTTGESKGSVLEGEAEINSIRVQENVVPAADGGYMAAVQEVNGHDYYFRPLEGGKMVIYDLDKYAAGEESLVATVTTGLYYPTHATVTNDGKVIVGGDGKKMFIFDTKTMTGKLTPDFRAAEGLEGEGHNQGSHYGSDGYIYFGTCYGGHIARYDMDTRTYVDLGDVITASVRELAGITENPEEETGKVTATCYHNGYVYAKADSDNYTIIVKQDVANRRTVAAIDVSEQLKGASVPHGITVLGDKYLIAGGSGASGMVLIELETFELVAYEDVVAKGLFSSFTTAAQNAWENGMGGHASEVINGKQYFYVNNSGIYSYNLETGKMARENSNYRALRTGQKSTVTLDMNKDGVEETYVLTFAGSGPRLFNVSTKSTRVLSGLTVDMSAVGGSAINIGTAYDGVLYIGAWNNWNCAAFDSKTETFSSRYVTGGQTDSQTHYVDEEGNFHLISGNYSACVVYEIDPINKTGYGGDADTNIIKPLISNMKKYDQKRIHTVVYGDGYVFAGTIPGSYMTGGGVGTYNVETETEDFIHFKETATAGEKCVPAEFSQMWDLSVKGIVYSDGRLFGATTRSGGSGSTAVEGTSAQIFVLDYENMAIEATLDLREYLTLVDANKDGVEDPIDYVGGISVDPVVEGRLWGIVSDVLFCFEYDKTEKTFQVQEILHLGHSEYKASGGVGQHNRKVVFDTATNSAFVGFYNYGLYQIKLTDWNADLGSLKVKSSEQILKSAPETYALGANNNIYYASGTSLYMKPVNVETSDWTEAEAVDKMIRNLGSITVDKADEIIAATQAYNDLPLRQKALVQEKRALQEAQAQIVGLKLAEIAPTVTAEDYDALYEINRAYMEMTDSQKRYVRNIELLEPAFAAAVTFQQNESLNQLQKDIFALDEITLADSEKILQLRLDYDALSQENKSIVKADKLFSAEEQLKALRLESGADADSGTCGEDIRWVIDSEGTLTISGAGAIGDYAACEAPWYKNYIFINTLILDGRITAIGDNALAGLGNVQVVYYGGTQKQKDRIRLGDNNEAVFAVNWHYGYEIIALGSQTVRYCSCCDLYYLPEDGQSVFADIQNSSWQLTHAIYACKKGLMAGKGTDAAGKIKFDPDSPITREEFVQVLYNAEGKPAVESEKEFPDVVSGGWYKNAVLWAYENNIASGMGNGSFGVGKNITRQDLAMMLYKYAAQMGYSLDAEEGKIHQFADGDKVAGYAAGAMDWAVTNGILSGKGAAGADISTFRLDPTGTATRAECAAMLRNFRTAYDLDNPDCKHPDMIATEALEAVCETVGNIAYWYCPACNAYFSDAEGVTEITYEDTFVEAPGHGWLDATCTTPKTCSACGATEGETLPHSLSFVETVAPTCGDQGYDLYECDDCDYTEKQNFTATVGAHTLETMTVAEAAPRCYDLGNSGLMKYSRMTDINITICTKCGYADYESVCSIYTAEQETEIMVGLTQPVREEFMYNDALAAGYTPEQAEQYVDTYRHRADPISVDHAKRRAQELASDYSHNGKPGDYRENINRGAQNIQTDFENWINSSGHRDNIEHWGYPYVGYARHIVGDNETETIIVYSVLLMGYHYR